jgi:hypothetical protein
MKIVLSAMAMSLIAGAAMATPVIDGVLDAGQYTQLGVQNTQTGFGTANIGDPQYANGSALANMYYRIEGGNLYLFIGGNVESNFNKLELFFANGSAGQNTLRGDNPNVDFDGLNRMGTGNSQPGLTFDAGFQATHYFTMSCGGGTFGLYANAADLTPTGGGVGNYLGTNNGQGALSGGTNFWNAQIALDNSDSSASGGSGTVGPSYGNNVFTGVELCIPLASLGSPSSSLSVMAFINGSGHDYVSNQVLGGIGGGGNLADPRSVNFANIAGDQFFTIPIPTPGAAAVLGLGALAAGRRRRA